MKKIGIFIEVLLICIQMAPGLTFAQARIVTSKLTPKVKQIDETLTPMPTKATSATLPIPLISTVPPQRAFRDMLLMNNSMYLCMHKKK